MDERTGLLAVATPWRVRGLGLKTDSECLIGRRGGSHSTIAWPDSSKINSIHGDSREQLIGLFGDYQFTCLSAVNPLFPGKAR